MAFRQFVLTLIILVLFINFTSAQTNDKICGTIFYTEGNKEQIDFEEEFERWMRHKVRELQSGLRAFETYTIPVIFHVIHNGEPVGQGSNLDGDKIMANLAQLNLDFANQSGSIEERAADMQIQFCPAKTSPETNILVEQGINRINRHDFNWTAPPFQYDSIETYIKPSTIWNPNDYLNIWIINQGLTGYATYPINSNLPGLTGTFAALERNDNAGVVVKYTAVGSINNPSLESRWRNGRTLTHEIGHFFGLYHIWGGRRGCYSDYCGDTPTQRDSSYSISCPTLDTEYYLQNCPHFGDGNKRMFENYMDYTNDSCMNTFTLDQKFRAQVVMQNSPRRVGLASSNKCCPQADLTILMPSVNPVTANVNDIVAVGFAVQNSGSTAAGHHVVSFHLSSDDILTPGVNGDIYIGESTVTGPVHPLSQTILLNNELTIPSGIDAGTYYLFMSADGAQVIPECDELNNFATVFVNINTPLIVNEPSWRYWFDDQFSSAIHQAIHSGQNNFDIQKNINIAHLTNGLHTLHFQLLSEQNKWSSISSSFFYKSAVQLFPFGSARYQYWINNYDYRATINLSSSSNFHLIQNINMDDLEQGLHTFHIRFKPGGKHWSSVSSSFFYKPKEILLGQAQYEYWYDDDYTNKTTTNHSVSSDFILLNDLTTESLMDGLHKFNIRFRPNGKHWSSVSTFFFYKMTPLIPSQAVYQYWIDNSFENPTTIDIQSNSNFILMDNIDFQALSKGLHVIHFRFKIDGTTWSSIKSSFFVKDDNLPDSKVTKCVYWFNDDFLNYQTVLFNPSANVNAIIQSNTDGLGAGTHTVSMFFQDENGLWSSIVKDNFDKSENIIRSCPDYQKFVSGLGSPTNSSYQWQVHDGTGYTNISNTSVYNGINTDTLILSNAPSLWYGYLYRCIVTTNQGTLHSAPVPLRFVYYWDGSVDNNWETAGNWNCNIVPGLNADVIINSGNVLVNSNVTISSLTLGSTAEYSVPSNNNFTLTGH